MLIFNFLFIIGITVLFVWTIDAGLSMALTTVIMIIDSILFVLNCIFRGGFMQIDPNEARVMIFFGKYEGTVKENGFW